MLTLVLDAEFLADEGEAGLKKQIPKIVVNRHVAFESAHTGVLQNTPQETLHIRIATCHRILYGISTFFNSAFAGGACGGTFEAVPAYESARADWPDAHGEPEVRLPRR